VERGLISGVEQERKGGYLGSKNSGEENLASELIQKEVGYSSCSKNKVELRRKGRE